MRIFRYLDQAGQMGFGRFDEQGQTFLIEKKPDGEDQETASIKKAKKTKLRSLRANSNLVKFTKFANVCVMPLESQVHK